MMAIVFVLRFQWELALGLEEKSDRIACHPTLWPVEGQDVMDPPRKYLDSAQLERTRREV